MKSFIFDKKKISIVNRVRIAENRDLKKGLRLNRNERVENFEKNILLKIFKNSKSYDLGKYPDQNHIYKIISNFLKINEDNIIISSGIDGSLKSIFEIFTDVNDEIAILSPTYAMYEVYSKIFKTKIIRVGYKNFKLQKKQLYKVINNKKIKILFIPNPNQPIDDYISSKEIQKISKLCKKNKIMLVIDEAYHMFGSQTSANLSLKNDHVLTLRTLSKSFGLPSIRFGYVIASKKIIKIFNSYRLSYESNYLTDKVVEFFIKNFAQVKSYITRVVRGRNYLSKELRKINIQVIGGTGNFLLINFNSKELLDKVLNIFMKEKIYVKANYQGELANCILVTCGPLNVMKKLFSKIKLAIK